MLTYTCMPGFDTNDPVVTVCGSSFTWSLDSVPPVCLPGKNQKFEKALKKIV